MSKSIRALTETHPEISAQANGWDPSNVTAGSSKKLSWKCNKGHVWEAPVYSRTSGGGCPYCKGRLPIRGETDLATTHPELAKEALFDATKVKAGTSKRLPWRCADGHEWNAYVYSRTKSNSGCPYCAGQKGVPGENDLLTTYPTLAAESLEDLTGLKAGSHRKVRWKCESGHEWNAAVYSRAINGRGCPMCAGQQVVPGENDLATRFPDIAIEAVFDPTTVMWGSNKRLPWRCSLGHEWVERVASRTRDSLGCPYCSGKRVLPGFNDLATTHPELSLEALFDPTTVTSGSGKKVPWRCANRHEWNAVVGSRARNGMGCPVCAGQKIIPGLNDLATLRPELAREALFDATTIAVRSGKKLPWRCPEGHVWKAVVATRSVGVGCPYCAERGYSYAKPGWLYLLRNDRLGLLQFGISNVPDSRLATHRAGGWECVDLRGPMDGTLAADWERAFMRLAEAKGLTMGRHLGVKKFTGYTEAWPIQEFAVWTIRDLMDAVEQAETDGLLKSI